MNIAIAGAGLAGRVVALNLLRCNNNMHITFFDKNSKDGTVSAGFTAAGMLAPYSELETAESIIAELGCRSIELWPSLCEEIGLFDGYEQKGSLITAHSQDFSELEHFMDRVRSKIDTTDEIKRINHQEIKSLEPDLSNQNKGFWVKNEAVVDAQNFIKLSVYYFDKAKNVEFREFTEVKSLKSGKVYTEKNTEKFDWVFDTRGLGAKEHFSDLRGVRGEVLWVETNDINIQRPTRVMHPRYKIYIVPRNKNLSDSITGGKRYIIGATEMESEDISPISARSAMELLSALYVVHPSFGEARVVNSDTNCRPAFKDNLPRIENQQGLTRINGLYRHGWLLAPAIVEEALNKGILA